MNNNRIISPTFVLSLIFGLFVSAVMPPLGFMIIVFGTVQQVRKVGGSRRDRRARQAHAAERARRARMQALRSFA